MTKYFPILFIVILTLTESSCSKRPSQPETSAKVITVDLKKQLQPDNAPLFTDFEVVKLETKDDCLLARIDKVVSYEDKLFILTEPPHGEVFVFDRTGKFLYKLRLGRGPGELLAPSDMTICETDRKLLVLDVSRTAVSAYEFDGTYAGSVELTSPHVYLEQVGGEMLLYDPNYNRRSEYMVTLLNRDGEYVDLLEKLAGGGLYNDRGLTKIDSKHILVGSMFSDIIYQYSAHNGFEPKYHFDYGRRTMNPKEKKEMGFSECFQNARTKGLFFATSVLGILNDNLLFGIERGDDYYFGRYDISGDSLMFYTRIFADLPNYYHGKSGNTRNAIIYDYGIQHLIKHFEQYPPQTDAGRMVQSIATNPDDNPILIFAKL